MQYILFDPKNYAVPSDMVIKAIERGAASILLEASIIPDEFFDLSNGLFGELLHKMSIYHMKLAIVISDPGKYSENFQSFLNAANKGSSIRSFPTRQAAINGLEKNKS